MELDLSTLKAFQTLASAGGVTRAAESLGISQPAVSRQIRQLERSTQAKLIQRKGRGVALTQTGQLAAAYAQRIFELIAEMERALDDSQHLRIGQLAIGADPGVRAYLLPDALVRFRQRFGGISLHLEVGNSELLRDRLRAGSIEIALAQTALPSPEFESEVFVADELVAIVPRQHRFAARKQVTIAAPADEPFIIREPASATRSLVQRVFDQRKLTIKPIIALSSTEAVKRAVSAGLGVSIVSKMSTALEVAAGNLSALRLSDVSLRRPIYQIQRRSTPKNKAVIAFLCILKHVARGTLPKLTAASARPPKIA